MQSLEQASNAELLSSLTGLKPAQLLMERFGGLSPLARACFWHRIRVERPHRLRELLSNL